MVKKIRAKSSKYPGFNEASLQAAVNACGVLYQEKGVIGFVWYDAINDAVKRLELITLN